mmetsp:Transcript_8660/g.24429  ORF Transcript_8660/g.24429 Transcript_8660/m.24429 type:complete len:357 (-) Transcript_8660:37-1107(-)
MLQGLRVQVGRAQLLDRERQALAVHNLVVRPERLDVGRLDLRVARPHHLPGTVHGGHGLLVAHFDHDAPLVVPDRQAVGALHAAEPPDPLHAVVQRLLQAVRRAVPHAHGAVLAAGDDDGQLRVEQDGGHVVPVTLQRVHAALGLVVPHLHQPVVGAGHEVGPVAPHEVVHAVDALLVALQGVVRRGLPDAPHLDGVVQRRGGERVGVLGVEHDLHDVVRVALEHLRALPALLPVPQFDEHVVRAREQVRRRGVHRQAADVVGVGLKGLHLVHGVVVVHPDEHVVAPGHHPLLPRHELAGPHRQVRHLEALLQALVEVVPDVHVAIVQVGENPGLGGMEVHALDAVRPLSEHPLDV